MSSPASRANVRLPASATTVKAGVLGRQASTASTHPDADAQRHAELQTLADSIGRPVAALFALEQVHACEAMRIVDAARSNTPEAAGAGQAAASWACGTGDALYTSVPGAVLVIRTADCLPVFFDLSLSRPDSKPELARRMVGVIHAGWRGLAAGIVGKTLETALTGLLAEGEADAASHQANFSTSAKSAYAVDARVWCGPAISGERYEVSADVAAHFAIKQARPDAPGKFLVDLAGNAQREIDAALTSFAASASVRIARLPEPTGFAACTWNDNDRYYSHRRGDAGRNLNYIYLQAEE